MSAKKNCKYTLQSLKNALEDIRNGMPIKTASKKYDIPKTTLHYKHHKKYSLEKKAGAPTVLTLEEEATLVQWIINIAKAGFPVTKDQLLESVQQLLKLIKRKNIFKNDKPGRHWYEGFLRRHPQLTCRMTQNLVQSRAAITEFAIRKWFAEIEEYLMKENLMQVFEDASRIFNTDESAFFLCPKGKKALTLKGSKTVYNYTSNDDKECVTILVTASAGGQLPPPMAVFAYERIPHAIVNLMPPEWSLGKSENGWMTGQSFFEYISNIFHPWLLRNSITLPVILFLDGHKSHLTMPLSDFCSKNGIILISLLPNSTHMLQPLDVGVFKPLKSGWKKAVENFRTENRNQKLRKENVAPILDNVIKSTVNDKMLKNAFATCGLCPFNPNAINYEKLLHNPSDSKSSNVPRTSVLESDSSNKTEKFNVMYNTVNFSEENLLFVESLIGIDKVQKFKQHFATNQLVDTQEDLSLFKLWKQLVLTVNNKIENSGTEQIILEVIEEDPTGGNVESESITENELIGNDSMIIEGDWINELITDDAELETRQDTECNNNTNATIETEDDLYNSVIKDLEQENSKIDLDTDLQEKEDNDEGKIQEDDMTHETEKNVIIEADKNKLPFEVPSPFKQILFWPESTKVTNSKTKKVVKLPSVASSAQWKAYYNSKQEMKTKKEEEKKEKRRLREEKKENEKRKKLKSNSDKNRMKVKRKIFGESNTRNSDITENVRDNENRNFQINDNVIVSYNENKYPGIIEDLKSDQAFISVMTPSGKNWKWPSTKDVLWYNIEDIEEKIGIPVLNNKRGIYNVPEFEKWQDFRF